MADAFERKVCNTLRPILRERQYSERDACTFVLDQGPSFGTVWLVQGMGSLKGRFMPRLSIGLAAIGPHVAVLSTDLHTLKAPATSDWYQWDVEPWDSAEVSKDLLTLGLPWVESKTRLEHLAEALDARRRRSDEPPVQKWWQPSPEKARPRPKDSNALRFLSYCREAQGDYSEALKVWTEYAESLTGLQPGSTAHQEIVRRAEELKSKL